jgi:CubicO group peptidase (beta-lactamase class C family)
MTRFLPAAALTLALAAGVAHAAPLPADQAAAVDAGVQEVLKKTGVPAASVAVVRDGQIAYVKAYGTQRLEPNTPARTDARYGIGSISKQFTAAAILLLAEEGKLKLDDPVGKYVPNLTDGDKITIRQVLSHTSGYRDYWPQDYVMAEMMRPTTPDYILNKWARVPLDFRPGDQWQYSNTGYTIAGLIIEKVSGEPYMQFLQERIFTPLHMTTATETDTKPLAASDARGYRRFALGPVRPAPKEGSGWLYAMGGLAMTAEDLARWDVSEIDQSLLKPESYKAQQTPVILNDGKDSGYGLGVFLGKAAGRRMVSHGGEISGFLAENRIYPDARTAVVVLTDADFGGAQTAIADRIAAVLFPTTGQTPDAEHTQAARALFDMLRQGRIDRARFTENGNAYFSEEALADFKSSLSPLGEPTAFTGRSFALRGGMTSEVYSVTYPDRKLTIVLRAYPNGKVEQFMVHPAD